jgi:hypothetical protein
MDGFWKRHCRVPWPENLPAVFQKHPLTREKDKATGEYIFLVDDNERVDDCPAWQPNIAEEPHA